MRRLTVAANEVKVVAGPRQVGGALGRPAAVLLHVNLVHQLAQDDERRVAADAAAVQRQDAHFPARLVRRRRWLVGRLVAVAMAVVVVVVMAVVVVVVVIVAMVVWRLVVGMGGRGGLGLAVLVVMVVVVGLERVPLAAVQLRRALRFLDQVELFRWARRVAGGGGGSGGGGGVSAPVAAGRVVRHAMLRCKGGVLWVCVGVCARTAAG